MCVLEPTPDIYMYVYAVQCVLEPTVDMYMYSSLHLTGTCMCVIIHNSNIDLGSNSNSNILH